MATRKSILPLTCPSCGAKIVAQAGSERYLCQYCGTEHLVESPAAAARAQTPLRPKVPMPSGVRIEKDGKSAVIFQRWFSFKYIPMAFFCFAWDSFLFFWYSMAFSQNLPWIFVAFPVVHLAVGVGLTYSTLAGFLNRTVVELTREELVVWFEPLPWLGEKTVKVSDIKQFYCKEKISHTKNGTTRQYQLCAVTQDDHQLSLISNLESPDVAMFFEQQLEAWLRIPDQEVVGELRR